MNPGRLAGRERFDARLQSLATLCASTAILLAVLALVGWHSGSTVPARLAPASAPMPYSVALGVVVCGVGLLALSRRHHAMAIALGVVVAALGLLQLIEFGFDVSGLGDLPFSGADASTEAGHAGRIAPNTAVCLTLSGLALVLGGLARRSNLQYPLMGTLGSVVGALGAVALWGYLSGVETAYAWGAFRALALPTAIALPLLSVATVAHAWRLARAGSERLSPWVPAMVGVASATMAVALWQAMAGHEVLRAEAALKLEAGHLARALQHNLQSSILALERLAGRWETDEGFARADFESAVTRYLEHSSGLEAVGWVDSSLELRWIVPRTEYAGALGLSLESELARVDSQDREHVPVTVSSSRELFEGDRGVLAAVPIFPGGSFDGYVVGLIEPSEVLELVLREAGHGPPWRYGLALLDGEEQLGRYGTADARWGPRRFQEIALELHGALWRMRVWPSSAMVRESRSALPAATLTVGLLLAALLTLAAQLVRAGARRKEAAAEEQFRGLFESAPDAILIADSAGRIVRLNRQAERLFGWDRAELLGQPLATLLPDSLARDREAGEAEPISSSQEGVFESFGQRRDGSRVPLEISLGQLHLERGTLLLAILHDVSERRAAQEALARHAEELARSNAELERFAYIASHDLQEPLRMVASFTQLLADRYNGKLDEEGHKFIHFAVDGAKHMQSLINDLLTYSRVQWKQRELGEVNLEHVLQQVLSNLRVAIDEAGAEITHDPLPSVTGNAEQLEQLLQNLIGNAIKFRSERPLEIHLGVGQQRGEWLFSVRDNGIGIDSRHGTRIFEAFKRLHRRNDYAGTGIGLAICKKVVEHHRGRIWVKSTPGEGATFFFTLPDGGPASRTEAGPASGPTAMQPDETQP